MGFSCTTNSGSCSWKSPSWYATKVEATEGDRRTQSEGVAVVGVKDYPYLKHFLRICAQSSPTWRANCRKFYRRHCRSSFYMHGIRGVASRTQMCNAGTRYSISSGEYNRSLISYARWFTGSWWCYTWVSKLVTRNSNRVLLIDQYKCLGFRGFVVNGLFFESITYPVRVGPLLRPARPTSSKLDSFFRRPVRLGFP